MPIDEVRSILYDILMTDDIDQQENSDPQIKAIQNMGVSVSTAVAKNGIKIFQLQNVVQKKITHHVVRALKALDAVPAVTGNVIDVKALPGQKRETLEEVIEKALDNTISSASFLKDIERRFVLTAIKRHGTYKETAEKIKISYSKLMQVKRTTG